MDRLSLPRLSNLLFLVVCCCIENSAHAASSSILSRSEHGLEKSGDAYFGYSLVDSSGRTVRDSPPVVRLHKRYVDEAIPRLADNYYQKNSPTSTGKGYEKDLIYPDWNDRRDMRKMEMIGNMAVPVPPEPKAEPRLQDNAEGTAEETTPSVTKKPSVAKKASDSLENGKKSYTDPKKSDAPGALPNNNSSSVVDPTFKPLTSSSDKGENNRNDDKDFSMSDDKYPKEITNNTLLKHNITQKEEDHHAYYNSTFIGDTSLGKAYWVDMNREKDVIINELLSVSHRKASIVRLSFDFPFFGNIVRNMTVATGGFLYTGDQIHAWLAATQYIAPLMANFHTVPSDSHVRYRDNGTAFTVEWDHVVLEDRSDAGQFTFQVTLHSSGDIVFVYKEVPVRIEDIEDANHPVMVGLADAYIIDRTVFLIKRKTIYEYHRVHFKDQDIRNWTAIYMKALPTCLDLHDCRSCLTKDIKFDCKWCPTAGRCSTGYDRKRQDWNEKHCDSYAVIRPDQCHCTAGEPGCYAPTQPIAAKELTQPKAGTDKLDGRGGGHSDSDSGHTTGGMLAIVFALVAVFVLAMWVFYAYRNPHTPSGQVLIKYRPSHWTLRRGEARYTAATIHM